MLSDSEHPASRSGMRTVLVGLRIFGLGHEVDAAEHDHVRLGIPGDDRQPQRVTDVVADPVEDLGHHVVVPEDDRVPFLLQPVDLVDQRRVHLPLEAGDGVLDLLVYRLGRRGDLGSERKGLGHHRLLSGRPVVLQY